jgi:Rv2175c C-terminal domain of unknown function
MQPEASSWQAVPVTDTTELVTQWLALPDVAQALGLDILRARQLVRERQLLAVRRDGVLYVPAAFVQDGRVLKGLPGVLTLLTDARYSDEEALGWLFTADDSIPGTPVAALRENRGTEIKRRAQALGF